MRVNRSFRRLYNILTDRGQTRLSVIDIQFINCLSLRVSINHSSRCKFSCDLSKQHFAIALNISQVVVVENSAQARKLARLPLSKLGVQFIVQYEYEHRKTGAGKALDEKTLQQLGVRLLSVSLFNF